MKEYFQLPVKEFLLLLGDDGAQSDGVDEVHSVELDLVLAAPGAKDSTATPTACVRVCVPVWHITVTSISYVRGLLRREYALNNSFTLFSVNCKLQLHACSALL